MSVIEGDKKARAVAAEMLLSGRPVVLYYDDNSEGADGIYLSDDEAKRLLRFIIDDIDKQLAGS